MMTDRGAREALVSQVLDALSVPVLICDDSLRVVRENHDFVSLFGSHRGEHLVDVDGRWEAATDVVHGVFAAGTGSARTRLSLRTQDGTVLPVTVHVGSFEIVGASKVLILIVPVDEDLISDATSRSTDARVSELVVHDLNNLLTTGTLAADLALSTPEAATVRGELATIVDMLTQSRVLASRLSEYHRGDERARPLDLGEELRRLGPVLEAVAGPTIDFELVLDPKPSVILVRPRQLEQIILNLVLNARDAMPSGGRLRVSTRVSWSVRLSVEDSGMGMSDEIRARILEPFFSTKPEEQSRGIGLSALGDLIDQELAHLDIKSELGVGTTFTLDFAPVPAVHREAAYGSMLFDPWAGEHSSVTGY